MSPDQWSASAQRHCVTQAFVIPTLHLIVLQLGLLGWSVVFHLSTRLYGHAPWNPALVTDSDIFPRIWTLCGQTCPISRFRICSKITDH